jgi:hypothetical protein
VYGAGAVSALAFLLVIATGDTAVLGFFLNAFAAVHTDATAHRASGPGSPGGHFVAVNGAGVGVAGTGLSRVGAELATSGGGKGLASADLGAAVARLGAGLPGGPRGDHAVLRAANRVAGARFGRGRAHGAAKDGLGNVALATLLAVAAGLGAGGPCTPLANRAVDGAGIGVAGALLCGGVAGLAAVEGLGQGTGARLGASTAGGRARSPGRPSTDGAVSGALVGVAGTVVDVVGAALATGNGSKSDTSAGLDASAAGGGA